MIEKEGRGVDESPSKILSASEAALCKLFFTERKIVEPTVMEGVDTWFFLERSEKTSEFNELWINGKRLACLGKFLVEAFERRIIFTEVFCDRIKLGFVALIFLNGECLFNISRKSEGKWSFLRGNGKSEFPKSVGIVVRLLERES